MLQHRSTWNPTILSIAWLTLFATRICSAEDVSSIANAPRYRLITTIHTGVCDASGIVALNEDTFAAVGDELNQILIYGVGRPGPPLHTIDLNRFLNVDAEHPEVDLEGGTRIGNTVYWISSHGRNRKGKARDSRYRFFATRIEPASVMKRFELRPQGIAYRGLLDDMLNDARYAKFDLKTASTRPPKDHQALNIEGLTNTPDGRLLIGFRNPVPHGKALIATLLNPAEVVTGRRARFADPILLDLNGNGIRGMSSRGDTYLIVAGPFNSKGKSILRRWKGPSFLTTQTSAIDFGDLNPEAVTFLPTQPMSILLLSDDGTRKIDGRTCKKIADANRRKFRSLLIQRN